MHKCPEAFLEAKSSLEVSQRHHQVLTKIILNNNNNKNKESLDFRQGEGFVSS